MFLTRALAEQREKQTLAPYAAFSADSRGRVYPEPEDPYRTCFQRDRDRIIHSKAFRRLKGKTQVFVAHYGDHYRSRLDHSMEVAQLSRDVARMLNLNEDLAEAIGLAHDLGHTPFGHAGEEAMNQLLKPFGDRFEHNEQSRRIVDYFEEKKPDYPGLNLSFEVRDGLMKHRTTYDRPVATDTLMPSLEAQIVNIADEIAYSNHDIDDGLRSQILKVDDLKTLALWQAAEKCVNRSMPFDLWVMAMISSLITLMVTDLAEETHRRITKHGIKTVDQIYETPAALAGFSPGMAVWMEELKAFLFKNFYQSPDVSSYNAEGKTVIRLLFTRLMDDFKLLPEKFQERLKIEKPYLVVKDYIAGMTDKFALELYHSLQK